MIDISSILSSMLSELNAICAEAADAEDSAREG